MTHNEGESRLNFIVKQFLCALPLKEIQWNELLENITWDEQAKLIESTVFNSPNVRNPVKISYQKAFVKSIIQALEKRKETIHDIVFEAYGRLVALPDLSKLCYRHFVCPDGKILTFREHTSIVTEGTTGLSTWQAGVALAEWCVTNSDLLKSKSVFELGSGVGITGIAVTLLCRPSKIYLSDCHAGVLGNLHKNLQLNMEQNHLQGHLCSTDSQFSESVLHGNVIFPEGDVTLIDVLDLPWDKVDFEHLGKACANVILAADVVYDCELFGPLARAIGMFLKWPGSFMVLACTVRNEETLSQFLKLLESNKFLIEEEKIPAQKIFFWATDCPIRLFKIKNLGEDA